MQRPWRLPKTFVVWGVKCTPLKHSFWLHNSLYLFLRNMERGHGPLSPHLWHGRIWTTSSRTVDSLSHQAIPLPAKLLFIMLLGFNFMCWTLKLKNLTFEPPKQLNDRTAALYQRLCLFCLDHDVKKKGSKISISSKGEVDLKPQP